MGHILPIILTSSTLPVFRSKQITLFFSSPTNFEWYFILCFQCNSLLCEAFRDMNQKGWRDYQPLSFYLYKHTYQNLPQFASQFNLRKLKKCPVFWSYILCNYWFLCIFLNSDITHLHVSYNIIYYFVLHSCSRTTFKYFK